MKILDLYIARMIVSTSGLCLLILTGLSGIIKWVDQLRLVGRGAYTMLDAGIYVLFLVPRDIEMFFPMAVLLGALIGMGMLASNSELVVMQVSGMSRLQITQSAMKTAIPLMIMVMALGEWGAPIAEKSAKELQATKISGGSLIKSHRGIWAKDGDLFVNIGEVQDVNTLSNISLYEFNDQQELTRVTHANTAVFIDDAWQLSVVENTTVKDDRVIRDHLDTDVWQSSLTPDKLSVVSVKPEALSISGLIDYLDYLKVNQQDPSRYELALWRKVMQPVTVAVMMLVALSFVFGPLRTVTMGARVLLGVVAGFSFYISNEIFGPMSIVYELPAAVGAIAPSMLFTGLALYYIRK
ncbi:MULTISPECIES: LPS export ABC transporter permease LptG [unclassified Shewanella]|jgi:lipopolysaccharide export system permease protein|uniref:LPS export ABC transporter permease LptG n=1 Tax=unclassified Shewanella TaxID=196818 RepID=UPI000C34E03A|nr:MULTISPECIES: LPS export ABC transporter permease LptG [unclassified Shewanella]MBB1363871.1 LPS export ABC transporter permease LptG [Shewanella sp. SR44-4]MBO1895943.1 LPS export ABC transporter permease LptG [Shewanella sp. BF02_Schw]PKH33446.1 lipopolysaccharide ABC transporter permease LptG [Shewanella sp. ALD9]QHS12525.1 LPS export ABC transporter permease LptG [Shewanella sp. Arc9-LZ]|tara:strand:+ start:1091 stop:2149 length:1059 start_codon:yes stop_codon:yes gene_type:complete